MVLLVIKVNPEEESFLCSLIYPNGTFYKRILWVHAHEDEFEFVETPTTSFILED